MTFREAFVDGSRQLAAAPVPTETPDLDARVLLGHCAGLSHAGLLARWPEPVSPEVIHSYQSALGRRIAGEPVAWIVGFKEFCGLDFEVGPGLLVPRADTETLVEAALGLWPRLPERPRVADVCTGTGCIAVSVAALADRPAEVWACDLSPLAVDTAGRNAHRLLTAPRSVTVVESDLLEALAGPFDLVVSNPPYLTPSETEERVGPGGWKEPSLALDGGGDGLDLIRHLVPQAASALAPGGWLLIEAADAQMLSIGQLFTEQGLVEVKFWKDLAGQTRVAGARRPPPGFTG
jgi:release factor glutamine methyltransferase